MKKFFSYIFTFLMMFVISLATTVSMSVLGADNTNIKNNNVGIQGGTNASFFTGIIDTFGKEKKFEVKGNLNITVEENEIPIILYVAIDMQDMKNLGVQGFVKIKTNDKEQILQFNFLNNTIYLSYNDINLKLTMTTIGELVGVIKTLIPMGVQTESIDLSKLVEQLMPTLMSALDNMKEETLDNGDKKVSLSIPSLADAMIVVSEQNVPKHLEVQTSEILGLQLAANIDLTFNENLIIKDPQKNNIEYFDLNNFWVLAKNLSQLDKIKADVSVDINKTSNFAVELLTDISNKNFKINLKNNDFGYVDNAEILLKDKNLYLSLNEINVLLSDKIMENVPAILSNLIKSSMADIKEQINIEKLSQTIKELVGELSFSEMVGYLTVLKDFSIDESGIYLSLDLSKFNIGQEVIELKIEYNQEIITNISLVGIIVEDKTIDLNISLEKTQEEVEVNESNTYLDLYEVYLENKHYVDTNSLDINLNFEYITNNDQITLDGRVLLDIQNKYFALTGNISGFDINQIFVVYEDDIAYLFVNNIKIQISKQEAESLISKFGLKDDVDSSINSLMTQIGSSLGSVSVQDLIPIIASVKNISIDEGCVSLTVDASIFGLEEDVVLEIGFIDNILKFIKLKNIAVSQSKINAAIEINSKIVEPIEFNKNEFLDVTSFISNTANLLEFKRGSIDAIINAEIGEQNYKANISAVVDLLNNYVSANLNLSESLDLGVRLDYIDGELYACINDIYVKVDVEFIKNIITNINLPTVDTDEIVDNVKNITLVNNIINLINGFNLDDLKIIKKLSISSSHIEIVLDKILTGSEEDLIIYIELYKNKPNEIEVLNLKINDDAEISFKVSLSTYYKERELDKDKYLDIKEVASSVNEIINFESIGVYGNVNIEGLENIGLDISLIKDGACLNDLINAYLGINISYKGHDLKVIYDEQVAYLQLNNIKLKLSVDQAKLLLEKFNIQIPSVDILESVKESEKLLNSINIESLIKGIKEIKINSQELIFKLELIEFGIDSVVELKINFNNGNIESLSINGLNIENKEINLSVNINVNEEEKEVFEKEEYLDVLKLVENVLDKQYLTEGTINAEIDALIKDQSYKAIIDMVGSIDNKYLSANVGLIGDLALDLRVDYIDNDVYLIVNDIYIKICEETISKLFNSNETTSFDTNSILSKLENVQLVTNINNLINEFKLEKLNIIKTITIDSSKIEIVIDKSFTGSEKDLNIVVDINNSDLYKVSINNLKITDDIELSFNVSLDYSFKERDINKDNYLDVVQTVNNLGNIIESDNIQINAGVEVSKFIEETYENYFNIDLDLRKRVVLNDLMGYLAITLSKGEDVIDLETHYLRETLYANFNGLKVSLEKAKLLETVNTVLAIFGQEYAYNDILNKVISILDNTPIMDVFGDNIEVPKLDNISFNIKDIETLIKNIKADANNIYVKIDGLMFGFDSIIDIELAMNEGLISNITINKLKLFEHYIDASIDISMKDEVLPVVSKEEAEDFIDLYKVSNLVESTYETLKNGVISGNFDLEFDFLNERHSLIVNYGINLQNNDLVLYINTYFKGLLVNIYYINGSFYLDIVGLKIYIEFEELNDLFAWINNEFGTNIDIDVTQIDKLISDVQNSMNASMTFDNLISSISNIDFSFVQNVKLNETIAEATLGDVKLTVDYNDVVNFVTFDDGFLFVKLYCTDFTDFTLDDIDVENYEHYSLLINVFDAVVETIMSKQYNVHADAEVLANDNLEFDVDIDLAIDALNTLGAYGFVSVKGNTNVDVVAAYENEMLYVNYDKLALSMHQKSFRSILATVLEVFGVDPSTINFLSDVTDDGGLDSDNLMALIPALDFENPLNMLKMVKGFKISEGIINLTIDGKLIFNDQNASDMTLNIVTSNGRFEKIELLNIYSGKANGEFFNLRIEFNEFKGVKSVENTADYIDISNSSDLIRAFVNTSALNDYHINGKVNVSIALGDAQLDAAAVGVDAQIKLDEDKKPIISVELNNYPLIGVVNNANTNGVGGTGLVIPIRERKITIIYKDGFCYLRTNDASWGAYKELDRITKVSPTHLVNNIEYYMQWLLGFTDVIMNEIHSAVELAQNREAPINLSNVLLSYKLEGGKHIIELNLEEIANNSDLGTMIIKLSTVNNESTNNKDYLYELGLNINMLGGIIILKTDEDNTLYLTEIGKSLDLSSKESYMNSYSKRPYGEYESKDGGSYSQTNTNQTTITVNFDNGQSVGTYTGVVGQGLSLPLPTKVVDDGVTRITYKFIGYYDDNGKLFNQDYYGPTNVNLVAKWEVESVVYYRTITLVNDGNTQTIKALAGETISLPNYDVVVEDKNDSLYTTTFNGWYHSESQEIVNYTIMPDFDDTLYARFSTTVRKYVYLTYDFMGKGENKTVRYLENQNISHDSVENYLFAENNLRINYQINNWCNDSSLSSEFKLSVMPSEDITIYANWIEVDRYYVYTARVYDNGSLVFEKEVRENASIPFSGFKIDDYTKYYYESNYVTEFTNEVMPSNDIELHVRNRYLLSIVSLQGNVYDISEYHYQGESYSMPEQISSYVEDDGNTRTTYTFNGWTGLTDVMPNQNLRVVANWSSDVKHYYTVTFELCYNGNSAFYNNAKLYKNGVEIGKQKVSIKVLEGNLDLTEYSADWKYTTGSWIFEVDWWYNFQGFSTSKNGDAISSINITGNTTIYGLWSGLKS